MTDITKVFIAQDGFGFNDPDGNVLTGMFSGTNDPFSGAGEPAPIGSLFLQTTGTLHIKSSAPNTGWLPLVRTDDKRLSPAETVTVQQDPGPGEFSSIATAMASITTASSSNPFLIRVFPGVYTEPAFIIKSWVFVEGVGDQNVMLVANSASQDSLTFQANSGIRKLSLTGATTGRAVVVTDAGNVFIQDTTFLANQLDIIIEATSAPTSIQLHNIIHIGDASKEHTVHILSSSGNLCQVIYNSGIAALAGSAALAHGFEISGTNARVSLNNVIFDGGGAVGIGIEISNGANVSSTGLIVTNFGTGLYVPNTGAAPTLYINGQILIVNPDVSINILHPGTTGFFSGAADHDAVSVAAGAPFSLAYNGIDSTSLDDISFCIVRSLLLGSEQSNITNVTDLIQQASATGVLAGGVLTRTLNPLEVEISAGYGYVVDSITLREKRVTWTTTLITVNDDAQNYIYVANDGSIAFAGSLPNLTQTILLGRARTGGGIISFLARIPLVANAAATELDDFLRKAIGPIFGTGSIATENVTPLELDVTSGTYYYSKLTVNPSGGAPITFIKFFHTGGVQDQLNGQTVVDNANYDDLTNLTPLTSGWYAKHSLYLAGDGSEETYAVIIAQAQYATLLEAQSAVLPNPPVFLADLAVPIAALIIQEGNPNIVQIQDIRPKLGFTSPIISGGIRHGDLLGLSSDDHLQYLLVSGVRAMSGDLDMGGNSITNVNLVDGVDVPAHASRHGANSIDPIATAAPITTLTPTTLNAAGIADTLSRSDHTHALSIPLSGLIAASGPNSINNGDNAQTWNWALTTAGKTAFTFTENTAAINGVGAQFLVDISTIATSTTNPIRIRAQANNILTVTNVGIVTLQGADTGTGRAITIRGGNSSTAATTGGDITLNAGTAGTSGTGGAANLTGGIGGTTGDGGQVFVRGGPGGTVSGNGGIANVLGGTPVDGNGGGVLITGGNAVGSGVSGGPIQIKAGTGGPTGNGASTLILGGAGGGTSGNGGNVTINGGIPINGNAGGTFVLGGNGVGTDKNGGAAKIQGGQATGTGLPGDTTVAGALGVDGVGGAVFITGGTGSAIAAANGGQVIIFGGNGGAPGNGGSVTVSGGVPTDGNGGAVTVAGRAGVGTNRAGGNLTLSGGNATGTGTAGSISITAGALGGAGSVGTITLTGGAGNGATTGGAITATAGSGGSTGIGAAITIKGGPGGSVSGNAGTASLTGGTPVDGNGGAVTVSGSNGVGTNRSGGNLTLAAGNPTGTGVAAAVFISGGALQGAGSGGSVNLNGGAGNSATTGGTVNITGGNGGSTGNGAQVTMVGGPGGLTSGNGGSILLQGGQPVDGNGGAVTMKGSNGVGTNRSGGATTISAGAPTGNGQAGSVNITGATGATDGQAGQVAILGGAASGAGFGGTVTINGGAGGTGIGGADVSVKGGNGGSNAGGGNVNITGGSPTTSGIGGSVIIAGNNAIGTNQIGGIVTINGGNATGSGTAGTISLMSGTSSGTTSTITFSTNGANQRGQFTSDGSFVLGSAALTTIATDGFLYITTAPGVPTGVPTSFTGRVPFIFDSLNDVLFTQANTNAANSWRPVAAQIHHRVTSLVDEFTRGGVTTQTIGQLLWTMGQSAAATNTIQASITDHQGIFRLVTGATSGNNTRIFLNNTATGSSFMANQVAEFTWIISIPTITNIIAKVGLSQDASSGTAATFGTDGVWFEFSSAANANWRCYTRSASTSSTPLNTTVAVSAGNWYVLRAVRNSTTNWEFFVNGVSRGTIATNLPTVAVNTGAIVQTATTAARNLDVDYFNIVTEVLGNRFT